MLRRSLTALGLAALVLPTVAEARNSCAPRDTMVERLTERYGEAQTGAGLGNATTIVEVWSSEDSGSFTVLVTRANGTSCIIAAGQNWRDIEPVMASVGDPA